MFSHKTIIHNYGHGGAGISMSYGTAKIAVGKMMIRFPKKDVA